MRNRNKINQLGRTASHRNALMMNLANALITHKRISTTVPKAKALRGYVEPLITKSKNDTTHSRRNVFRLLKNKESVAELFREVAPKVGERPGGYTRIIKTGFRAGDSAEMCIIELVDFNEVYTTDSSSGKKKTRRSRRGGGGGGSNPKQEQAPKQEEKTVTEEAIAAEAATEEKEEPKVEEKAEAETEEAATKEAKEGAPVKEVKAEAAEEAEEAPADDAKKEGDNDDDDKKESSK